MKAFWILGTEQPVLGVIILRQGDTGHAQEDSAARLSLAYVIKGRVYEFIDCSMCVFIIVFLLNWPAFLLQQGSYALGLIR